MTVASSMSTFSAFPTLAALSMFPTLAVLSMFPACAVLSIEARETDFDVRHAWDRLDPPAGHSKKVVSCRFLAGRTDPSGIRDDQT